MLAHFPTLYTDELLYSGISRYHLRSGNRTQQQTVEDLFGERVVCATADLPSHLNRIANRLGGQYTVDQLIRHHTLFPYYSLYLQDEICAHIELLMANDTETGVVHASLGLLAGLIKSPSHLKYCPQCYREEIAQLEPYWHRSHQLPGVVICERHKVPLILSNIIFSTRDHKFAFNSILLVEKSGIDNFVFAPSWEKHLQYIVEKSAAILQSPSNRKAPCYKNVLYKWGYLTASDSVRSKELIADFREFYSDQFLHFLQCGIATKGSDTWLHKLIRGSGEITQPLRHLLLCRFLGESIEMLKPPEQFNSFGQGPWPCLNKAADHYKEEIIEKCIITRCTKTGLPVGTFSCSCGFVYSRRRAETGTSDILKIGRTKVFGEVWISRLKELNETDKSLRKKAVLLGVDPATVKRQTELLKNPLSVKRCVAHSKISVEKVRRNNTPKKHDVFRVDWGQRDELLYREVKDAVEKLRASDEPSRITVSSIARAISTTGLSNKILKKSLDKMPATKELVQKSIESTQGYQIRRLLWAAEKIDDEGGISGWRLLKLAGLSNPLRQPVKKVFDELLNKGV